MLRGKRGKIDGTHCFFKLLQGGRKIAPISVIMLTYNRENLVVRAIECLLAQTLSDFEFIIVNNGSTDRSGIIADNYAVTDSRIRVIHKEKGNIGSGRNAGLDAASGEWIAFIDDDDWFDSDFLEFLYNLAIENKADISICGAYGKPVGELKIMNSEQALETLFWRVHYNNQFPTKLISHTLFNKLRFSNTAKYDDIELMTYIIASASKIAYEGKPKYTFYRHDSNNSAWTKYHHLLTAETLNEYLEVYKARTEWLCNKFPRNAIKWKYFRWSFMLSMVEKIKGLEIVGCETQYNTMTSELRERYEEFYNNELIQDFEKEWMSRYIYAE